MNGQLIGYKDGDSFLYRLSGTSKLIFLLLATISVMISYDTRLIAAIAILAMILLYQANIKWRDISFVVKFITVFAILNIVLVYLFSPQYGEQLYGSSTVLISGLGSYHLSSQELFYLFNLALKYFCTVPLAILFLMTTHPSQFAASLNQIGVSYRAAYSVSLTLRYIPDVQEEYQAIKMSQEARGFEMSKKASIFQRIKGNVTIILPLIFSSLDRIDTISTAMVLRRFGKNKMRTWYVGQKMIGADFLVIALAALILVVTILLFKVNAGRFWNLW